VPERTLAPNKLREKFDFQLHTLVFALARTLLFGALPLGGAAASLRGGRRFGGRAARLALFAVLLRLGLRGQAKIVGPGDFALGGGGAGRRRRRRLGWGAGRLGGRWRRRFGGSVQVLYFWLGQFQTDDLLTAGLDLKRFGCQCGCFQARTEEIASRHRL